ncbi:MAG: phosphatidate cytidylyltransferase [Bacteroidetes bacterium]|nr:phosphatidate cytidylyltransferase [Bacteroidota bacterium]
MNWPTFFTRLGSAVVFCAIMLAGLLWNEWSFLVLVSLIQVLCLREFFGLMKKVYHPHYWPSWLPIVMQICCLLFLWEDALIATVNISYIKIFRFFPLLILGVGYATKPKADKAASLSLVGVLYIALPMLLLCLLYQRDTLLPLMVILMLWCNDTLAYLVGSFIGKTPLTKISPKKTWEGTLGGIILTIVAVYIWSCFKETNFSSTFWMGLALVSSVAGTFGDLLESKLKRMADVKDSGTMMPGHGGALDRFDSLLIATPFAFIYVYLFIQ